MKKSPRMVSVAPISQQIWDMKYRLKGPDGAAIDRSIEDTWRRVAHALAEPEQDSAAAEETFVEALADFRFLPAGRIVAGAGSGRDVTLFNCFVMGTIPDDMAGIFQALKEAALTMQQGGGIGYDFSTLRPKGAPVKGVGADASGPLSFMNVWDAMCRTIMSAGYRRGAMMATLRCDHPDIEAFIEAKREPGTLRMFNLSVLVTDKFMDAVKHDLPWELSFRGTVYNSLRARDLWEKIMRATYAYAEPGVIFIDRINRMNNLAYAETIAATNPCVTADTWVHTTDGPRTVSALVGQPFRAVVDGVAHDSDSRGFFATGRKPVLVLRTIEGHCLRLTADHPVLRVRSETRYRCETEWAEAAALQAGDTVVLHDHGRALAWDGAGSEGQGYLLGLLIGDGTLKRDKAVLSAWPGAAVVNGHGGNPGVRGMMAAAEEAARQLPHRSDFHGWMEVAGRGEYRLATASIKALAADFGLEPGHKTLTPAIERGSAAFCAGVLRGLFDTDGSVQGSQAKGLSLRLLQSDLALLQTAQRMLLRFGIDSRIYANRRDAGVALLPDGQGGGAEYPVRAQHELVIAGAGLARFAERIGLADGDKLVRLRTGLAAYRRAMNRQAFTAVVESLTPDGEEDVFDVSIPGVNAFDANGLFVHNCGEQPLPPYGNCLLGSINLAKLVRNPFADDASLDEELLARITKTAVRMLDNAIDVSRYPLPEQKNEAKAKRRIGLGLTGLADALILVGVRYDSGRGRAMASSWMRSISRHAYLASTELAAEKGAFPLFDAEQYLAGEHIRAMDADVRAAIAKFGIRNALLTSVAPTGTISLLADNVSSGLEPVFSFAYERSVLMPDGSRRQEEVSDYAFRLFRSMRGDNAPLPKAFISVQTLIPSDHVQMQAAVQEHVDSAVSKTINVASDTSFEAFQSVYLQAYESGCKGCTTFRPNEITGSVLSVPDKGVKKPMRVAQDARYPRDEPELPLEAPKAQPKDALEAGAIVYMTRPLDRPNALPGNTYKVSWPEHDHAFYITINDIVQDGRRRPFEVFINSKNMEHYAWTVALTRMISAVFRRGGDVNFVAEELKAVFDPRGGQWVGGHYVPSLLAAIGEVIEQHLVDIGFTYTEKDDEELDVEPMRVAADAERGKSTRLRSCPKCSLPALIRQEGCDTCTSCGYSKCS